MRVRAKPLQAIPGVLLLVVALGGVGQRRPPRLAATPRPDVLRDRDAGGSRVDVESARSASVTVIVTERRSSAMTCWRPAAGGHWSTFVIWAKHHVTLGRSDYQRQYEPILYGWREGTQHFWCGDRNQGDVWAIKRLMANLEHPSMKPVELVERALLNSSRRGDTVLDLFGGSGTTLVACEKAGRQARLVELDLKYCDVIVRRWEAFACGQAHREGVNPGCEALLR